MKAFWYKLSYQHKLLLGHHKTGMATTGNSDQILTSVRALGWFPIEHMHSKNEKELQERKLRRKIKHHWNKLSKETLAELKEFRAQEYGFIPELLRKRAGLLEHKDRGLGTDSGFAQSAFCV